MKKKINNPTIDSFGTKHWYKNGLHHRDGDKPAVEYANGDKYWFKNGLLHREGDLPAIENANGYKAWYKNDICYRFDNWIEKPI